MAIAGRLGARLASSNKWASLFARFRTDVFRFHEQGRYDQALGLIAQEAVAFPEETSGITYWRICLLARRRDAAEALKAMTRAIETGWWRAELWFRNGKFGDELPGSETGTPDLIISNLTELIPFFDLTPLA